MPLDLTLETRNYPGSRFTEKYTQKNSVLHAIRDVLVLLFVLKPLYAAAGIEKMTSCSNCMLVNTLLIGYLTCISVIKSRDRCLL